MRIKVLGENKELFIEAYQSQVLLDVLLENKIWVSNPCHGNGVCGKCKVRVVEGSLPITEADRQKLSKIELEQGIRLACKAKLESAQPLTIEILGRFEENILVESVSIGKIPTENFYQDNKLQYKLEEDKEASFFIAIDIGTTTIAMALVNKKTGAVCDTYTSINHQRKLGADVISRIEAANGGKADELKNLIAQDLWNGIRKWIGISKNISRILIAGNTTMIHLLMGYSCKSLGKYPFVSEYLGKIDGTLKACMDLKLDSIGLTGKETNVFNSIYEEILNIPVTILPGISAFVGADVVADLLACPEFESGNITLLIDLGTNGEMVLGNKNKLLVTSTAAGPAFEGGNISCGTASIPASICRVKIQNQRAIVRTIEEKMPPLGVCGSGLISSMAELKRNKLIDEDGNLRFPYEKNGYPLWNFDDGKKITITQKDIREFQMAKSAIRAGMEILMEEYGCSKKEIKYVYLAGGFGKALNIEDIFTTGILPREFKDKMKIIGNGVLQGEMLLGLGEVSEKKTEDICQRAEAISLSQNINFQKKYMEYMKL